MINYFAKMGGLYVFLAFAHFIADWLFQLQTDTILKIRNKGVRALHCFVYTFIITLTSVILGIRGWSIPIVAIIIYASHFYEDSYHVIRLWAKHIRKASEFQKKPVSAAIIVHQRLEVGDPVVYNNDNKFVIAEKLNDTTYRIEEDQLLKFISTTQGYIFALVFDQIMHLGVLWIIIALLFLQEKML